MNAFEYVTAEGYELAAAQLAKSKPGETLVKAGGIDVLDRLKERIDTPKSVLNMRVAPVRPAGIAVRESESVLAIDALTTMAQVAENADVQKRFPALARACNDAATPQVRNAATIGGNLCQKPRCWYFRSEDFHCLKKGGSTCYAVEGDNRYHAILGAGACHIVHPSNAAVALLALGASVRVVRNEGGAAKERTIGLDKFFRVPANPLDDENILEFGELIREVTIPLSSAGPRSAYLEVREKVSFDWPLVSCAVNLNDRNNPRVVMGAVAPIPWRMLKIEELLIGKELGDELTATIRSAAAVGAKPMTHNAYKVQLVGVIVERALREANK